MTVSIQATLLMAASSSILLIKDHNAELHPQTLVSGWDPEGLWRCGRVSVPAAWFAWSSWLRRCWFPPQTVKLVPPSAWQICDYWGLFFDIFDLGSKISHLKNQTSSTIKNLLVLLFLTSFPHSEEERCSSVFHPCESQLLLFTHVFQMLDYPAVQKPITPRSRSKLATNRSHGWAANSMPFGKSVSDPDWSLTWLTVIW